MKYSFIDQKALFISIKQAKIEIDILRNKLSNYRRELKNLESFQEEKPDEKAKQN